MNTDSITIHHGSQRIIMRPEYGKGKPYNDYGQGFYCTESLELAKEWACPTKQNGFVNTYMLNTKNLKIFRFPDRDILGWLSVLLANRTFTLNNPLAFEARKYLLERFLPDISSADVIIGYRADDSYFSFAEDFINGAVSVRDLSVSMRLGNLGEQIVLISKRAFENLEFMDYKTVDYSEYYFKRTTRDLKARKDYSDRKNDLERLKSDVFIIDILREELKPDDQRLRPDLSE